MRLPFPVTGLYAITQVEEKSDDSILADVCAVLKAGVSVIQYRDKRSVDSIALARKLLALCKHNNVPLIINDDPRLAASIGADGVHLGKNDGNILTARKIMGSDSIIGLSCYDNISLALQAESEGADYVAFGRFFPSTTKPLASSARIATLVEAKKQINIPVVAIGGILPENGKQLLCAGADVLAVIGGIFDHDPEHAAKAYIELFKS